MFLSFEARMGNFLMMLAQQEEVDSGISNGFLI
jgi:hypothetical protein